MKSKSQNRCIRNTKRQGSMTPDNVRNHITKNLMDIERDEISVSELK
jgi:hypothetical protein